MTHLALYHSGLWQQLEKVWKNFFRSRPQLADPQEDNRNERDYILEMMERCPDALQSDFDAMTMAQMYCCKY